MPKFKPPFSLCLSLPLSFSFSLYLSLSLSLSTSLFLSLPLSFSLYLSLSLSLSTSLSLYLFLSLPLSLFSLFLSLGLSLPCHECFPQCWYGCKVKAGLVGLVYLKHKFDQNINQSPRLQPSSTKKTATKKIYDKSPKRQKNTFLNSISRSLGGGVS